MSFVIAEEKNTLKWLIHFTPSFDTPKETIRTLEAVMAVDTLSIRDGPVEIAEVAVTGIENAVDVIAAALKVHFESKGVVVDLITFQKILFQSPDSSRDRWSELPPVNFSQASPSHPCYNQEQAEKEEEEAEEPRKSAKRKRVARE